MALLHDYHRIDDEPWPVQAGLDGYVLGQSVTAEVVPGQHILVVARDIRRGKYPGGVANAELENSHEASSCCRRPASRRVGLGNARVLRFPPTPYLCSVQRGS